MATITFSPIPSEQLRSLLQIQNEDKGCFTCVGHAPSKQRRCQMPIALGNREKANHMISTLPQSPNERGKLLEILQTIAESALCKRFHQGQSSEVASRWYSVLVAELNKRGQTSLVPRAPAASLQVPVVPVALINDLELVLAETTRLIRIVETLVNNRSRLALTTNPSTDNHSTDNHSTYNHSTDNHSTDNQSTDNHSTDNHSTDNHSTDNQSTDNHSTDNHSTDNHSTDITASVVASSLNSTSQFFSPPPPLTTSVGSVVQSPPTQQPSGPSNLTHLPSETLSDSAAERHEVAVPSSVDGADTAEVQSRASAISDDCCGICFQDYDDPLCTPCGHVYCRECITTWLNQNNSCPHDRRPLSERDLVPVREENGDQTSLDDSCAICCDAFEDPQTTPCGHVFCRDCISPWLRLHDTCPFDRRPLHFEDMVPVLRPEARHHESRIRQL